MQTAQLDEIERMLQAHLNNIQMARCTGTPRRTEAPPVNRLQARDQNHGGVPYPRGHGRRSRMEDVD